MLENWLKHIRNVLEYQFWRLNYRRLRLKLPFNPRKQVCECCGFKGWSNIHHWSYSYTYTQIREDNNRALDNTTEVCFPCHQLGNAIRQIFEEDPKIVIKTTSKKIAKLLELRKKALEKKAPNKC